MDIKKIKTQDNIRLKDLIDSIPPKHDSLTNQWFLYLARGFVCYGNIALGEYKEKLKEG